MSAYLPERTETFHVCSWDSQERDRFLVFLTAAGAKIELGKVDGHLLLKVEYPVECVSRGTRMELSGLGDLGC